MSANFTTVARIKHYFLKGVLAVYVIAFASLYVQTKTLFGDNGIVPLRDLATKLESKPSAPGYLAIIGPKLGLSHDTYVELICLAGILIALSACLIRRLANVLTFGLLWYTYWSLCSAGQGFMTFHSDLLLLEVGFISILLAPFLPTSKLSTSDTDHIMLYLIKWLVIRYFTTNVINVYADEDKAWYDLTAIPMVAQGVQFPSLFTWHIFNAPTNYFKLFQAYEHSVRLVTPFLAIFDLKHSRLLAFYSLLFITLPTIFFFNFGWTDLLMTICLLVFLKDAYFFKDKRAKQSTIRTLLDFVVILAYIGIVTAAMVKVYGLKLENGTLSARMLFTPSQFKFFLSHFVPIAVAYGIFGYVESVFFTLFRSSRKTSIIKVLLYTIIAGGLFVSTIPTITRFSPHMHTRFQVLDLSKDISRHLEPLKLSNNYLLMSKISANYADGRPELQIQGRESAEDQTWQQFEFKYKLGHPSKDLARIVPHLPRVELKMWYAARSSLQQNQWLHQLAYRLATQEPSVIKSLTLGTVVGKIGQVRVVVNKYKYSLKSKSPAAFWSQAKFVSEYMTPITVDSLKQTIKSSGASVAPSPAVDAKKKGSIDSLLGQYLEISSDYIRGVDQTVVIWTVAALAVASMWRA